MSSRSLSWTRPASKPTDDETVAVRRGDLRELAAGLSFLRSVCEANDASDPDDPSRWPDDRRFLVEASNRVAALAAGRAVSSNDLCDALAKAPGDDGTRTRQLVDHLAREGRAAADDLLSYGLYVTSPHDAAALLLAAAAKRHAG